MAVHELLSVRTFYRVYRAGHRLGCRRHFSRARVSDIPSYRANTRYARETIQRRNIYYYYRRYSLRAYAMRPISSIITENSDKNFTSRRARARRT